MPIPADGEEARPRLLGDAELAFTSRRIEPFHCAVSKPYASATRSSSSWRHRMAIDPHILFIFERNLERLLLVLIDRLLLPAPRSAPSRKTSSARFFHSSFIPMAMITTGASATFGWLKATFCRRLRFSSARTTMKRHG